MDPFDLSGPDFLGLYLIVALAAVALAAWLRWRLRLPAGAGDLRPDDLSAYHLAYLAGGQRQAVNAAVAKLVTQGALTVDGSRGAVSLSGKVPEGADPLEYELLKQLRDPRYRLRALHRESSPAVRAIERDLTEKGLLVAPPARPLARLLPTLLVLAVAVFGTVKIGIGVERDKSVGALVFLVLLTVAVGLIGFARRAFRSRRGDLLLEQAQSEYAALQTTAQKRAGSLSASDLSVAVALFGVGVLTVGPLADLRAASRVADHSVGGSCGAGCGGGGGGCGGGGGGGGCGGGGGGCGGCGG